VNRGSEKTTGKKGLRRPAATKGYAVTLSPNALARILIIATLTLLVCHGVLTIFNYRVTELPWLLLQLFDVDQENNLPTWFSELLLLIACASLWVCAKGKRAEGNRWSRHWYVLFVGFLLMAIDEVAGVHESINSFIVVTWAIPMGIASLLAGLAFIPFLGHLPNRIALLFVVAGLMFVTGAAGLEIIGNSLVAQSLRDTLEYNMWTLLEEALEMFGVILFTHTLLTYMRKPGAETVDVSLKVS